MSRAEQSCKEGNAGQSPFSIWALISGLVWPGQTWPGLIIPAENQYNPSRALRLASCVCVNPVSSQEPIDLPPEQTSQDPLRRRRWTMDGLDAGRTHTVQRFRGTLETKTSPDQGLHILGGAPRHFTSSSLTSSRRGDRGTSHGAMKQPRERGTARDRSFL